MLTSNARSRSNEDVDKGFIGMLIPSLRLDGAVRRSSDVVASIRVCGRPVSLGQRRQNGLGLE